MTSRKGNAEPWRRTRHAELLRRTMHGPMWHGPAVLEATERLTATQAASHPIAAAHSAWELVLHIAAWAEIATARLNGTPWRTPTKAEDFPPALVRGGTRAWTAAKARAAAAYETLAVAVETSADPSLDTLVIGQRYSRTEMLHGVVEHGVYHAGQIVLLRKIING